MFLFKDMLQSLSEQTTSIITRPIIAIKVSESGYDHVVLRIMKHDYVLLKKKINLWLRNLFYIELT